MLGEVVLSHLFGSFMLASDAFSLLKNTNRHKELGLHMLLNDHIIPRDSFNGGSFIFLLITPLPSFYPFVAIETNTGITIAQ